jgi:hypothetical protein
MQPQVVKSYLNFTRGFFTESTPLNYPDGSCIDIDNIDISRTGRLTRRKGLAAEIGYTLQPTTPFVADVVHNQAIESNVWSAVNQNADLNFAVVQIANMVYFCDLSQNTAISSNLKPFTINLDNFKSPSVNNTGRYPICTASGNGYLFITSPVIEPFYITYNKTTDAITTNVIVRQIRDYDGVEDGLKVDENPTTLSIEHHYNLLNQGWTEIAISNYFTKYNNYPSNAQVWWAAKDADGNFDVNKMAEIQFGTTRAGRGHFIVDPFNIDRATVSGISGLPIVKIDERPPAVDFNNGRLYFGVNQQIFYSQILSKNADNVGKFLSQADSASEIDSILVASDGGVINIPNAGKITTLTQTQTSEVVGTTNGIWAITGPSGQYFSAIDYRVMLVSDVIINNAGNICKVEDALVCVSDGGMYLLQTSDRGNIEVQNISLFTIQTFYLSITKQARSQSKLTYDSAAKKLYMFYNPDAGIEDYDSSIYTNALILDLTLYGMYEGKGGFYKYSLATLTGYNNFISDAILLRYPTLTAESIDMYIGDEPVLIDDEQVIINEYVALNTSTELTFLIISGNDDNGYQFTFGQFDNPNFVDWFYVDDLGISFDSYLLTAPEMLQDITRNKGLTYVWCLFDRTEQNFIDNGDGQVTFDFPSGCLMESHWEWTSSSNATRWSNPQQVYRLRNVYWGNVGDTFDYSYDVIETKTSVSGHGKAVSLKLYSQPFKDFRLLAIAAEYTVVPVP